MTDNLKPGLSGSIEIKKPDGTIIKLNLNSKPYKGEKHGNSTTPNCSS